MQPSSKALGGLAVLLTSLVTGFVSLLPTAASVAIPDWLSPGQPCAVAFQDDHAVVDLFLGPDEPVKLLVSSLSMDGEASAIEVQVEPLEAPPRFRPLPVVPLKDRGEATHRHQPILIITRQHNNCREGEAPAEPKTTVRSKSAGGPFKRPPAVSELKLVIGSAGASPSHRASVESMRHGLTGKRDAYPTASATRDFWLHVTDTPLENPKGYQCVHASLIESRQSVDVYADDCLLSAKGSSPAIERQARDVAERLELDVLPAITKHIGPIADPDHNGRLSVLLTPWLGRLRGGTVSVRGFVRSSDFRTDLAVPYSNHTDLLYLNSDLPTGPALKTLLLHEVAHAALAGDPAGEQSVSSRRDWDDWLNEGLAHLAERRCGGDWSNLDHRIAQYQQSPASAPLVVRDYYRSGRWRDHGCRGATYLFLDWCERHARNQGVTEFTPTLIATGRVGPDALEQVCGAEFAELYRAWTVSMVLENPVSAQPPKFGRFENFGPRFQPWDVNQAATQFYNVSSTATQFVELRAARAGWYRIGFRRDNSTRWQLTVIKSSQPQPVILARGI